MHASTRAAQEELTYDSWLAFNFIRIEKRVILKRKKPKNADTFLVLMV